MFFQSQSKCEQVIAWWQRNVEYRYDDDALRRYYSGVLALAVQALHDVTDLIFTVQWSHLITDSEMHKSTEVEIVFDTTSFVLSWKVAESAGPETWWIHTVCRKCGAGALQQR